MKIDFKSLKFKNWLYFVGFTAFILILFWILQIVFLQNFYENMKTQEMVKIGDSIVKSYDEDKKIGEESPNYNYDRFRRKATEYAFKNNMKIYMFNQDGRGLLQLDGFIGESDNVMAFPVEEFLELKNKLDLDNNFIYFTKIDEDVKNLIYGAKVVDTDGNNVYFYITSPLAPVDSTVSVLERQLMIITLILVIVSPMIAQEISKRMSVPITSLTKSAKKLAKGDFTVRFDNDMYENYTEISELSNTLNYATEELSKMDEYRKELIANVSHDLKTPLTIIKFYGEMIQDVSGDDPVKRNEHCELIIKETDRLTGLVNEVLELSKLQSGSVELERKNIDVGKCVHEVLDGFNSIVTKEDYTLKRNIDEGLVANINDEHLKRVIYNLVSNAINYTGDDKAITVNLRKTGKKIRFEVIDTGHGIAKDEVSNIWERYYKSKENHNRGIVGTGLGLSIVKNILQRYNASFGVETEEEKGSMFWFEI